MAVPKNYRETSLAPTWLDRQRPSSSFTMIKKESNAQTI
ncbi:uncharacterized protein METZ01_LOCUS157923 [marine metagenome]|uniref:Uncharacterized protein n=1 Tax=marine metagenome TaxID=408172 RepID=A0A382AUF5_9ZZZZ